MFPSSCPKCHAPTTYTAIRRYHGILTTTCVNGHTVWEDPAPDLAPDPLPAQPTAQSICAQAAELVGGSRQVTHGDKSINFQNTADLWNALLQIKARQAGWPTVDTGPPMLTALDVGNMLELFKVARRYGGSFNLDDYVDGAGYAGCAGEIAAAIAASAKTTTGRECPTSDSTSTPSFPSAHTATADASRPLTSFYSRPVEPVEDTSDTIADHDHSD